MAKIYPKFKYCVTVLTKKYLPYSMNIKYMALRSTIVVFNILAFKYPVLFMAKN